MAVSGVFAADFSQFHDAVTQSTAKLRELESEAVQVGAAVDGMTSGSTQELNAMTSATAATNAELQRMGDAPDDIKQIGEETKKATKDTDDWTANVKSLALAFVSIQTLKAGWNFVADIAAQAGALQDLSEQTRINVEDLQIMSQAMADFGVSTDELGRGLFKLSNNIANGDDGVADALLNMGLSIEQVKGLKGEELFLTIQNGLAKLDGSLRDTTAVTLYGEKLGMSMAGAAEGTQEAVDAARKMNNVMSTETVAALDSATEAIDKMKGSLTAMAANAIGPVAEGFNNLVSTFNKGASAWQIFIAMGKDFVASNSITGPSTEHLTRLMDQMNQSFEITATRTKAAADAGRDNAAALNDQAGATKRLRESQAGLKDFEAITRAHKENQDIVQRGIDQRTAAANKQAEDDAQEIRNLEAKRSAGLGWMNQVKDFVTEQNKATQANKDFEIEQEKLLADLAKQGELYKAAGDAAESGGQQTVAAFQGVAQQVELTSDGVRGWIELMKFTNRANAILNRNSLFTTSGQLEEIANIPSFAGGVQDFAGGVARVHQGELLVNLPSGTSVIPKGNGGGGIVVSNTFHLTDTESNLARRVSETIMRTVRAGTQLGTA